MNEAPSNNEASSGTSALDDGLGRVLTENGLTMEEHLLYLASEESHWRLRNTGLPRGVSMRLVDLLRQRDYLHTHMIHPDSQGSICEYSLTYEGKARLRVLRGTRSNAKVS